MDSADDPNRLGQYLQARRGLVTPDRAGIPAGPNRRVPGLRREEVAMLAGISADYYLRLERGRDAHPSVQVLEALARVLLLDEVETAYLLGLAAPRPRTRRRRPAPETVPARLHDLLRVVDAPAFVEGRVFDVLAANPLAAAFSPRLVPGANRLRSLLLDPEERAFHVDWDGAVRSFVALFRNSVAEIDDPRVVELVGELSLASGRFREEWARHDVRPFTGGTTEVDHPLVGRMRLHREKLAVDGLVLVVYHAESGSIDEQRLRLLQPVAAALADGGTTTAAVS